MSPTIRPSPRWARIAVMVLIYGGLLAAGQWGGGWLSNIFSTDFGPAVQSHEFHVILAGIVLFAVLMAIPFVPGIEISLALLALFGAKVAMPIYAATVAALGLSYLIGRLIPLDLIAKIFGLLGLTRAVSLVRSLQPLDAGSRFEVLLAQAPKRVVPTLLKHRYVAIIIALNVPGNAVIGGGGGIAMLAGMSGLFIFPRFLASVALAALPVPLFIILSNG
ncbi:MAG: hypothetical protein O3A85_01235 [Proteobacteria bacterium]|nr:hypothetical protein [Pseudomonadota bacterium]